MMMYFCLTINNWLHTCRYLGNMYMAEALVYVDRIADAIQHLSTENVVDISTVPPEHKSEQGRGLPDVEMAEHPKKF